MPTRFVALLRRRATTAPAVPPATPAQQVSTLIPACRAVHPLLHAEMLPVTPTRIALRAQPIADRAVAMVPVMLERRARAVRWIVEGVLIPTVREERIVCAWTGLLAGMSHVVSSLVHDISNGAILQLTSNSLINNLNFAF